MASGGSITTGGGGSLPLGGSSGNNPPPKKEFLTRLDIGQMAIKAAYPDHFEYKENMEKQIDALKNSTDPNDINQRQKLRDDLSAVNRYISNQLGRDFNDSKQQFNKYTNPKYNIFTQLATKIAVARDVDKPKPRIFNGQIIATLDYQKKARNDLWLIMTHELGNHNILRQSDWDRLEQKLERSADPSNRSEIEVPDPGIFGASVNSEQTKNLILKRLYPSRMKRAEKLEKNPQKVADAYEIRDGLEDLFNSTLPPERNPKEGMWFYKMVNGVNRAVKFVKKPRKLFYRKRAEQTALLWGQANDLINCNIEYGELVPPSKKRLRVIERRFANFMEGADDPDFSMDHVKWIDTVKKLEASKLTMSDRKFTRPTHPYDRAPIELPAPDPNDPSTIYVGAEQMKNMLLKKIYPSRMKRAERLLWSGDYKDAEQAYKERDALEDMFISTLPPRRDLSKTGFAKRVDNAKVFVKLADKPKKASHWERSEQTAMLWWHAQGEPGCYMSDGKMKMQSDRKKDLREIQEKFHDFMTKGDDPSFAIDPVKWQETLEDLEHSKLDLAKYTLVGRGYKKVRKALKEFGENVSDMYYMPTDVTLKETLSHGINETKNALKRTSDGISNFINKTEDKHELINLKTVVYVAAAATALWAISHLKENKEDITKHKPKAPVEMKIRPREPVFK